MFLKSGFLSYICLNIFYWELFNMMDSIIFYVLLLLILIFQISVLTCIIIDSLIFIDYYGLLYSSILIWYDFCEKFMNKYSNISSSMYFNSSHCNSIVLNVFKKMSLPKKVITSIYFIINNYVYIICIDLCYNWLFNIYRLVWIIIFKYFNLAMICVKSL